MDTDVLVIGGGAAGLAAATRLSAQAPDLSTTLVDPSEFNTYRPWIQYALPGLLATEDLQISLRQMAERHGFTFYKSTVDKLDQDSGTALADGEPIRYRRVIIASGAPTDRDAIPGAAQHAIFPCDLDGFQTLRQWLRSTEEGTLSMVLTGERISPGLEDAAWLARTYHTRGGSQVQIRVIADGDCFTDQFGTRATRRIRDRLEAWGAELVLGASVRAIAADHVALSDGRILSSTLTAVVGALRGPQIRTSNLTDEHGFFVVEPTLRSSYHPSVFVAGDAIQGLAGLRKNWQLSVRQATLAADNALRSLDNGQLTALETGRDRRMAAFSLPDVGGAAFLVFNRRLLSTGKAARRLRIGFDRKHFAAYLPDDARWRRMPG